ncbi:hypothetical protein [Sulfurimonas marina]|uniref:DUF177 domain-containing protein n=1 Tax=Sulfurimonas marina TaxID=2590551 RepID=A0A7M1AT30_9BACT|nr:hypothetical protein [Sulfurimonas marina]QOP40567.1 DUF177 domain-containing protein [Sulfurimonas marina]
MKILLRKVTNTPVEFELDSNEMTFKGYLEYYKPKLILLKANLNGKLEKPCDICAEDMQISVDEDVEFYISDGIYKDEGDIELDVVESFDGHADLDELLHSEIEMIKSDYHSCDNCKED